MKNLFAFILLTVVFSCNNAPDAEEQEKHPHPEVLTNLHLNNGLKWKVDAQTNKTIIGMQQIVELYEIEKNKSPEGYAEVGQKLDRELKDLIANCKMTGPDHDALHEWLVPFMTEVDALIKTQVVEEAEEHFEKLDAMLHKYYEFFE